MWLRAEDRRSRNYMTRDRYAICVTGHIRTQYFSGPKCHLAVYSPLECAGKRQPSHVVARAN